MLALAAGVPIVLVVWSFMWEIRDIRTLKEQNPLPDVAAALMERIDLRLQEGVATVQEVASVSAAAGGCALTEPVPAMFLALFCSQRPGSGMSLPSPLPDGWDDVWPKAVAEERIFDLMHLPDGRPVLVMATPLAGTAGGWVAGLFDVQGVLGQALLERMRVAQWGDAFVADRDGRIFLSAHPRLLGRTLADLGLAGGGARPDTTGQWRDPEGRPYWVSVVGNPGWFHGPHRDWRVGLMVLDEVQRQRHRRLEGWVMAIITVILAITVGMALVLRRSIRGRR